MAGPDEVLASAEEEGCLAAPDGVLASAEVGCLPGPEVDLDGTVDAGGLAFPLEIGFGRARLVSRDEVDGPVEAEDGPVEKLLAGFVVFLA